MANDERLALLQQQDAHLDQQEALIAAQRATMAELKSTLVPAPPSPEPTAPVVVTQPPPPAPLKPAVPYIDPISGLAWRSGFGQCANALDELVAMRSRAIGAYAGWSAFQLAADNKTGWSWLRGGASDDPEKLSGIFSNAGAPNFHPVLRDFSMLGPKGTLVWVFPMTPVFADFNNNFKSWEAWTKPGMWSRMGPGGDYRGEWYGHYRVIGARLGVVLSQSKRAPENLVFVLGWEATGTWYPWSVGPDAPAFVVAWRLAVDAMREGLRSTFPGAEDKVRFEFRYSGNTNLEVPWEEVWPGKDHAQVLGVSLHSDVDSWGVDKNWQTELDGRDPDARGNGKVGLQKALAFAKDQGVKLGLDEWGVVTGGKVDPKHPIDAMPGPAIRRVASFLKANAPAISHECFLHSSVHDLLSNNPKAVEARTAYLETFGKDAV